MKLPNHDLAQVPRKKITEYLLNPEHRDGQHKVAFFLHFGFSAEQWEVLASALVRHAAEHEVTSTRSTPFGTSYAVEGVLRTPEGRESLVRSVWFIQEGTDVPRLTSAYPLKKRKES